MRSERLVALALGAALLAGPAGAQTEAVPAAPAARASATTAPTRAEVTQAIEALRQDPDFASKRKERTLRLKPQKSKEKNDTPSDSGAWAWLRDFARWITEAGRVAVWVLGAVVVALFFIGLRHWVRVRAGAVRGTAAGPLPSHVRDLDIRPESLPERIGEAAAALWREGQHRAALSLLYRGALSRLVHAHGVPIRAASTEGECVALAARRLPPERSAYVGQLVEAWQVAVYGARLPDDDRVLALCRDFDRQLRATPEAAA